MAPKFEIPENTVLVILGASGDLAKKKLVGTGPIRTLRGTDDLEVPSAVRSREYPYA